jgi:hypothetical protein
VERPRADVVRPDAQVLAVPELDDRPPRPDQLREHRSQWDFPGCRTCRWHDDWHACGKRCQHAGSDVIGVLVRDQHSIGEAVAPGCTDSSSLDRTAGPARCRRTPARTTRRARRLSTEASATPTHTATGGEQRHSPERGGSATPDYPAVRRGDPVDRSARRRSPYDMRHWRPPGQPARKDVRERTRKGCGR